MIATDYAERAVGEPPSRAPTRRAAVASRVMSFAVGTPSLAIAALAVARFALPCLDARLEAWGVALSGAVIAIVAASYAVAMRLARAAVPSTSR